MFDELIYTDPIYQDLIKSTEWDLIENIGKRSSHFLQTCNEGANDSFSSQLSAFVDIDEINNSMIILLLTWIILKKSDLLKELRI
jgi:hypothetical protein